MHPAASGIGTIGVVFLPMQQRRGASRIELDRIGSDDWHPVQDPLHAGLIAQGDELQHAARP